MTTMSGPISGEVSEPPIDVAICLDHHALTQLRPVIRHLGVGLVDLSARVRVITSTSESVGLASMGPIEVFAHEPLVWPLRRRRMRKIADLLAHRPPSVIYAISSNTYDLGVHLAGAFDTDLVLQTIAARDVDALDRMPKDRTVHVIAASEPLLRALQQREDFPADRCALVRPGVLRGTEPSCFRNENAIPSLVCAARLDQHSGIEVVVKAGAIVRDHGHRVHTFLVGVGPKEASLRKTVRDHRLSANVTFARPSADFVEVLRGADMFVLPPGDQDVSARPLQAMANGSAVICFDAGVADCFHHGETAVVCARPNAATLAEAIESLLADRTYPRRIAAGATEYVKKYHQMSTMAELTMRVFQKATLKRKTFRIPQ